MFWKQDFFLPTTDRDVPVDSYIIKDESKTLIVESVDLDNGIITGRMEGVLHISDATEKKLVPPLIFIQLKKFTSKRI